VARVGRPAWSPSSETERSAISALFLCTEAPSDYRAARLYNDCLLPEDQSERMDVVLVSPRNPLNIGAAARAMANFGFRRLAVVEPYAPNWREARSAVGAPELLQDAKESTTLAEAVAHCTLVIGTGSLTYRKPEQPVVQLPDLAPLVERELRRGGRVAMVFGPENHGLSREDLSYCQVLVVIPTDERQPSMNLGQAVAVCLYEVATRVGAGGFAEKQASGAKAPDRFQASAARLKSCPVSEQYPFVAGGEARDENAAGKAEVSAASGDLDLLAGLVEETMRGAGYSPRSMQGANRHDLRLLLRRVAPADRDLRRMLGLFRRILWRFQHPEKDGSRGSKAE
jgi:TrmH family RNA methyltransferase